MSIFASFDATPSAAPRSAEQACCVTIKPASDLTAEDHARWASLWARSNHGNIFAADWFMASALARCAAPRGLRLAVVHTAGGVWLGVIPLVVEGGLGRWRFPAMRNWHCALQHDASPLIEPGAEHLFWHALLTELDRQPGTSIALRLEGLPLDDPATRALIEVCLVGERRLDQTGRFSRPMLAHFGSCVAAPESVSPARRTLDQRLDRCLCDLQAQVGEVRFVTLERDASPADWIDQFLALERSDGQTQSEIGLGKCGRKAALFADVITAAARRGEVRLVTLEAGTKQVAMMSWFLRGGRAYKLAASEDKSYQSFKPGQLLMRAVLDEVARGPSMMFDSGGINCAPDDPLWPQAREIADYVMPIGGRARRRAFAAAIRTRSALAHLT